jgi:hypothetical protein
VVLSCQQLLDFAHSKAPLPPIFLPVFLCTQPGVVVLSDSPNLSLEIGYCWTDPRIIYICKITQKRVFIQQESHGEREHEIPCRWPSSEIKMAGTLVGYRK